MAQILKRTTRLLPVALTTDEIIRHGMSLAEAIQDTESEKLRAEAIKASLKDALSQLEATKTRLAKLIQRGEEWRDVEVEIRADLESGIAYEVRTDTHEVLKERPLEESERQAVLFPHGPEHSAGDEKTVTDILLPSGKKATVTRKKAPTVEPEEGEVMPTPEPPPSAPDEVPF